MVSGRLSLIKIGEFMIELVFDSGDSIAAYDTLVFRDAAGSVQSSVDTQSADQAVIPIIGYIGRGIAKVKDSEGSYAVYFDSGYSVELVRTNPSHEIGLVTVGSKVRELY